MQFSRVLALCLLFGIAMAANAPVAITVQTPGTTPKVGVWSDYYYVYTTTQPDHEVNLQMTDVTSGLSFYSNGQTSNSLSFKFDAQHMSFTYRVMTNDANLALPLNPIINTWAALPDGDSVSMATVGYAFTLRQTWVSWPATSPNTFLDTPSDPIKIYIDVPSTGDLTFTPTFTGLLDGVTLTFSPAQPVIKAGQLSTTFTYTNNGYGGDNNNGGRVGSVQVAWDVTGAESDKYTDPVTESYNFRLVRRAVSVSAFSSTSVLGSFSPAMYFSVRIPTNGTVTVTPNAADATFSPSSVTLSGEGQMVGAFNWKTTSPSVGSYSKVVNFQVSSPNGVYDNLFTPVTINVPKKTITVTRPSNFILSNLTFISFTLNSPVSEGGSLIITPYSAANLAFNQTSVTFTGNMTAAVIGVTPTVTGADQISFGITGPDADFYNTPATISVNVAGGSIAAPGSWFVNPINLFVAQESEKIPIRASFSPTHSVTAFFAAPDMKFNPPSVTFRNGSEQQYFTITPMYTDTNMINPATVTVNTLLQGPDATWFSAPSFTVQVFRRYIQAVWSAHITTGSVRHLGKPYKIWVSANYVGNKELFSVTPTSPYWSFSPKVLNFNKDNTRFELTATPTGIATGNINWVMGGQDGGLYGVPDNFIFNNQIRPLGVGSAVLSPDERQRGLRFDVLDDKYARLYFNTPLAGDRLLNSPSDLASYHTWSFEMRSTVLPDRELTITPKCAHATFSPSSITVNNKARGIVNLSPEWIHEWDFNITNLYLGANFTVHPKAAGTHYVWFELSGGDADYYQRPTDVWIAQNLVMRPESEPSKANSSPFLQPVFAFTALLSFVCYLIM